MTKEAASNLYFVNGLSYYTFDNFDLAANRPDLVVGALGRGDGA